MPTDAVVVAQAQPACPLLWTSFDYTRGDAPDLLVGSSLQLHSPASRRACLEAMCARFGRARHRKVVRGIVVHSCCGRGFLGGQIGHVCTHHLD